MATSPTCVVAYAADEPRFNAVRKAGLNTALASEAKLVLFEPDSKAARSWARPLRGARALRPDELEAAGKSRLAAHVREARELGIDAYGWLGRSPGIDDIERCAEVEHADLLVLPTDLQVPLTGWQPQNPAQAAGEEIGHPVVFVRDGERTATFPRQPRPAPGVLPRILAGVALVLIIALVAARTMAAIRARNRARRWRR